MRGWNERRFVLIALGLALGGAGSILAARALSGPGAGARIASHGALRTGQDLETLERLYRERIVPLRDATIRNQEEIESFLSALEQGIGWPAQNRAPVGSSPGAVGPTGLAEGSTGKDLLEILRQARVWEGRVRRDDGRDRRGSADRTDRADLGR